MTFRLFRLLDFLDSSSLSALNPKSGKESLGNELSLKTKDKSSLNLEANDHSQTPQMTTDYSSFHEAYWMKGTKACKHSSSLGTERSTTSDHVS